MQTSWLLSPAHSSSVSSGGILLLRPLSPLPRGAQAPGQGLGALTDGSRLAGQKIPRPSGGAGSKGSDSDTEPGSWGGGYGETGWRQTPRGNPGRGARLLVPRWGWSRQESAPTGPLKAWWKAGSPPAAPPQPGTGAGISLKAHR